MTKVVWRRIEKILDVLRGASDLVVGLKNQIISVCGKNSPYASHIDFNVDYTKGHKCEHTLLLRAAGVSVVVCPTNNVACFDVANCTVLEIPGYMIQFINDHIGPFELPIWTKNDTITVIFPNRFSGYDIDGNPCWGNDSVCRRKNVWDTWVSFFDYADIEVEVEEEKLV